MVEVGHEVGCFLRDLFHCQHLGRMRIQANVQARVFTNASFYQLNEYDSCLCRYRVVGALAGTSVIFEAKDRRLEMALYCLTRAIECAWNELVYYGYVKNIRNGEAIYFSLAMAVLCSLYHNDPETIPPSFRTLLVRILGKN